MKKIFILCVAAMMAVNMMAEGHLKFKGVEIDGQLGPFVAALQQQKYTVIEQSADMAILAGTFNGQDALVGVYTSAGSRMVYQVLVIFSTQLEEWSKIWASYTTYKERLQKKYGEPITCIEENRCSYSQDDPLFAIEQDQAEYKTLFKAEHGTVGLAIVKLPYPMNVQVTMIYVDEKNAALNESEVLEDL